MLALINEMLEISRIETGDIKLELQTVDIGELIVLVADGFADQMLQQGAEARPRPASPAARSWATWNG